MDEQIKKFVSFHPIAGSVPIEGELLQKWEQMGAGNSVLGYPTAPARVFKDGARTMTFQNGFLCFHPDCGTHYVTGKIGRYWADELGAYGKYGYPLNDPEEQNGAIRQAFQGGCLSTAQPELANGSDLRGEIARRGIAIRNQGIRGTCSVQVMVFLMEYLYTGLLGNAFSHLSVEYSNHTANLAENSRDDGHCFHSMEAGYNSYGIVHESKWAYNRDWVYDFEGAQKIASEQLLEDGKRMLAPGLRLNGRFLKPLCDRVGLSEQEFSALLLCLDAGIPVGVGRDHSLVAVGYRRDAALPGGGYIIFRNSWGTAPDFTGYQTESFAHVIQTVNDLYVYTY